MSKFRCSRVLVAATVAAGVSVAMVTTSGANPRGGDLSGEVVISGSSTVEPITSLVAELFAGENPDVQVRVDGPGTTDGFVLFCEGETDISDASRAIADEEVAACQGGGVAYTELPVAIDGLTIVANNESDIECLDFEQIYAMFGPESSNRLADAQTLAEELGSTNRALPSGSIRKFTPGPESGTYDSFIEITYEDIMEGRLEEGQIPADKVGTNDEGEPEVTEPLISAGQFPNDNDTVRRVEGTENGIGFLGFAFFEENEGDLKSVGVVNPETGRCVRPTRKTIQNGSYPISRTLYIYPNNERVASSDAVKGFIDFYMTGENLGDTVVESGYVPLARADRRSSIDTWNAAA